jgi:hypothetical protein
MILLSYQIAGDHRRHKVAIHWYSAGAWCNQQLCGNPGSDLLNLVYGYGTTNNNGNVQSQATTRSGLAWSQTYTYTDGVNRLTSATEAVTGVRRTI